MIILASSYGQRIRLGAPVERQQVVDGAKTCPFRSLGHPRKDIPEKLRWGRNLSRRRTVNAGLGTRMPGKGRVADKVSSRKRSSGCKLHRATWFQRRRATVTVAEVSMAKKKQPTLVPIERIERSILVLRN